jgi:hypothetical protein
MVELANKFPTIELDAFVIMPTPRKLFRADTQDRPE